MCRRILLFLPLAACAVHEGDEPSPPATDDPVEDSDAPALPDLPIATCHDQPYALVPERLGELVAHAPRRDLDQTRQGLDLILAVAELDGLRPTPADVEVHEFRYTTQDRGEVVEATGLVAIPDGLEGLAPVVLLVHSFAGLAGTCSPSGGRIEEAIESILVASRGFVVIAPDLIGLDGSVSPAAPHAPLVGEQVAIGAWDAWRAGTELLKGDLADELDDGIRDDAVLWGFSQGGHGVLFVDRYAPWLAPEVAVRAVVAGTPPFDLASAVSAATQTWTGSTDMSALIVAGMYRWYAPHIGLDGALADGAPVHLASTIEDLLGAPAESCSPSIDLDVETVEDLFAPAFLEAARSQAWDQVPPWGCYLQESSLPTTSVPLVRSTPTLMIFGSLDDVVPPETQAAGLDALCDDGADIEVITCEDGDHAMANLRSIPEQETWVRARLSGVPVEDGCVRHAPGRCTGADPAE